MVCQMDDQCTPYPMSTTAVNTNLQDFLRHLREGGVFQLAGTSHHEVSPNIHSIGTQAFQYGFTTDRAMFWPRHNLATSLELCAATTPLDVTGPRAMPQQPQVDLSPRSPAQQEFPPLEDLIGSGNSAHTLEPISPGDEASERRKEVS